MEFVEPNYNDALEVDGLKDIGSRVCTMKSVEADYISSDSEDPSDDDSFSETFRFYPGKKSFDDLWAEMFTMGSGDMIRKKVLKKGFGESPHPQALVNMNYCCYIEGEKTRFTEELSGSKKWQLGIGQLLIGMELAIGSMSVGEQAMFLVGPELMFGKMGCPPDVPPGATCLVYIKLLSILPQLQSRDEDEDEDGIFSSALAHHSTGKAFFKRSEFRLAVRSFQAAVQRLEKTCFSNEEQQDRGERMLLKLFINQAICFNKLNMPQKACMACNEIKRLDKMWNNIKALYQNAIAFRMMGIYEKAIKTLNKALKLEPNNKHVIRELKLVQEKQQNYWKHNALISRYVLGDSSNPKTEDGANLLAKFTECVEQLFMLTVTDSSVLGFNLPSNLNQSEMAIVKKLAGKYHCKIGDGHVLSMKAENENIK